MDRLTTYHQRYNADRKEKGICVECGKKNDIPERSGTCSKCLERQRHFRTIRRKFNVENGFCVDCSTTKQRVIAHKTPEKTYLRCETCIMVKRVKEQERRKEKRASGNNNGR